MRRGSFDRIRKGGTLALMALIAAASGALAEGATPATAALLVTSGAFTDGGELAAKYSGYLVTKRGGGPPTDCGGENSSPPFAWSNVPAGTRSFGLIIFDPDGAKGSGVAHWVAYGIAGERRALPEGFGTADTPDYVGGTSTAGSHAYLGPCPIPGHTNHYVFSLYALDLPRDALPPGLTREQFLAAASGHVLDIGSIVGRAPSRQRSP